MFHLADLVATVKDQFRTTLQNRSSSIDARMIKSVLRPIEEALKSRLLKSGSVSWEPVVTNVRVDVGSQDDVKVRVRGVELSVKSATTGTSVDIKCPKQHRYYGGGKQSDILRLCSESYSSITQLLRETLKETLQANRITAVHHAD